MTKQMLILCEAKLATEAAQSGKAPTGKIEARVTTWGPREGADGRRFFYKPEGFMDWAKEFTSSGRPLPMFVNHSADQIPVGEWTEFAFDDEGMTATGRLYMNTTQGADLHNVMSESPAMFGGVSVGAYAEEFQWVKEDGEVFPAGSGEYWDEGYFQITKGGLREVSVVMYPNNPAAEVQKLEYFTAEGRVNPRTMEKALREAGLCRKDATTASLLFDKILLAREAQQENVEKPQIVSESDAVAEEAAILEALMQRELMQALNARLKG
jgi:HK97 family phage prohead protease